MANMTGAEYSAATLDATGAEVARVRNAALGGKDNYAVDRALVDHIRQVAPRFPDAVLAERRWRTRVVRHLAKRGIDQFLDCGAGLPAQENTHEVVQRQNPDARVVYVEADPIVVAHGRALLEVNDDTFVVQADLIHPDELLTHPDVTARLDFTRPIALIQSATLHHVDDGAHPAKIMAAYVEALPAGSAVALSHWWNPDDRGEGSALACAIEAICQASSLGTGRYRTRTEIEALLDGLDLIDPGLAELDAWWPEGPALAPIPLVQRLTLGAVGIKP